MQPVSVIKYERNRVTHGSFTFRRNETEARFSLADMGKPKRRFVAKAEEGKGWRIWDKKQRKWWGERYQSFPGHLLEELNGEKQPIELKRPYLFCSIMNVMHS